MPPFKRVKEVAARVDGEKFLIVYENDWLARTAQVGDDRKFT